MYKTTDEWDAHYQKIEAMVADIDEIDAVIGQFLDFARGADEQKSEQDLDAVAAEVAEHYRRINRKVSLAPGEVKPFRFARLAVRRAITNLVDNALRYAGEPIEIKVFNSNHHAAVEVLDRGPGIPAAETERLKRPFTRLDAARSGPGGAGLGLALVERIAPAPRGRLELLPREGGGLRARLSLHTGLPTDAPA